MFQFKNQQLEVDPDLVATIPEIRQIWDRDQTEDKREAMAFFSFVFHTSNPKSPFFGYDPDVRDTQVILQNFPEELKKWKRHEDKLVLQFRDKYRYYLNLAPERELLKAAERTMADLTVKLNNPKTKNKESYLAKINDLYSDLEKVRERVRSEEAKRTITKGNNEIRKREDPNYKPLYIPKTLEDALR